MLEVMNDLDVDVVYKLFEECEQTFFKNAENKGCSMRLAHYVWDILFFLFAGKAYATFSLLFGFSFFIQFHNAEKRGIDFRGRFAWRMCLLFLFAQLHALFYNGDILVLYAVVGFALIPVCKLKTKTIFVIALLLLFQPCRKSIKCGCTWDFSGNIVFQYYRRTVIQ